MSYSVLVVGGAGYIGLHMVLALRDAGHSPIVFDKLSRGHADAVGDAPLFEGDSWRPGDIPACFEKHRIAAGCDPQARAGEGFDPETHLIPLVLQEATRTRDGGDPKVTKLRVFGGDFATKDGSCVRDYIHISDLCDAHLLAPERLMAGKVRGVEATIWPRASASRCWR